MRHMRLQAICAPFGMYVVLFYIISIVKHLVPGLLVYPSRAVI